MRTHANIDEAQPTTRPHEVLNTALTSACDRHRGVHEGHQREGRAMWPRSSRRTGGVPYTFMSSAMAGSTEDDGAEELVHLASLTPLTCVVGENPVPSRRQPRGPLGRHGDAVSERRCGVRCGAELMMSLGAVQAEKASW